MVRGLGDEKRERDSPDPHQLIIKLVIALYFYICVGDTGYFVIAWSNIREGRLPREATYKLRQER